MSTYLDTIEEALAQPDGYAEALRLTLEQFGADSGTIHLLGEDGFLHLKAASAGIPEPVRAVIQVIPVGKGMAGLAVERAEPVTTCNLQTDTTGDVRPGARQTGMEGALVVPIFRDDLAVGSLGIANRRERFFTEQETALLIETGRRLAGAVG